MKNLTVRSCIVLIVCSLFSGLPAQEALLAAGGDSEGSLGSASCSIGQLFFSFSAGPTGTVTEGIQQPYEISLVSSTDTPPGKTLNLTIFPNPVDNRLFLEADISHSGEMVFTIHDLTGKQLEGRKLNSDMTIIDLSVYPPSTYFVTVTDKQGTVQVFRIIKTR